MTEQTKTEEIWRDVPGYEIAYEVSNLGRVRAKERHLYRYLPEVILKPILVNGYYAVNLNLNGKVKPLMLIQKLVADAFVPKPETDSELYVKRYNSDKTDNRAENLYWSVSKTNAKDKIIQLTKSGEFVRSWNSRKEITLENPTWHRENISICLQKRGLTAYGFKWLYAFEYYADNK